MSQFSKLKEVSSLFFRLGLTSFGGPVAHIAMMEQEVVTKRNWMSRDHFLDLISATNLIPGPNSTEMAIHCGHTRAGKLGLWIAGLSFIFPAVIMTIILAWVYQKYGQFPVVAPFLMGIKPVVFIIILDAVFKFGKKALKNWELGIIGMGVIAGAWGGFNELLLLLSAGFMGIILSKRNKSSLYGFSPALLQLFWVFLKVGSVLFGSGYVLFAYLDAELIQKLGWLTRTQLIDAIAIGQFTPGPVLSSATFIGYQVNGLWGAAVATVGIFLPSFIFVQILNPWVPRLRKSIMASAFLDGVNVASVALMLCIATSMGKATFLGWQPIVIGLLSMICLYRFKSLGPAWLIAGCNHPLKLIH